MKDKITRDKNGQLVTSGCCQWRGSALFDSEVVVETFVLRGKFSGEIATEQQPPSVMGKLKKRNSEMKQKPFNNHIDSS